MCVYVTQLNNFAQSVCWFTVFTVVKAFLSCLSLCLITRLWINAYLHKCIILRREKDLITRIHNDNLFDLETDF